MELLFNVAVFLLFAGLWAVFGYALVTNRPGLDATWNRLRSLPIVIQALVAVLLLPLVIGLFIWQARWPLALRLVLVAGVGVASLYAFLPPPVRPA